MIFASTQTRPSMSNLFTFTKSTKQFQECYKILFPIIFQNERKLRIKRISCSPGKCFCINSIGRCPFNLSGQLYVYKLEIRGRDIFVMSSKAGENWRNSTDCWATFAGSEVTSISSGIFSSCWYCLISDPMLAESANLLIKKYHQQVKNILSAREFRENKDQTSSHRSRAAYAPLTGIKHALSAMKVEVALMITAFAQLLNSAHSCLNSICG
ncbi:unnamed protein product [Albugo candida]|uniref:Uncharacterized protein n=1 Tax=Albugo candida TaxID=65357 RepID=A0A024GP63_9STRA|nr:unnamed protein product [Albugo candida]|eukprot:CCI48507.1 unnamed protein product [Albugo candida]